MLFEKIRRTQKPVFIFLALIFGFGFVLLGVGSGTGGVNPLDIFGNNSGSSSSIDDLNQQVKDHPNDSAAWLSLARAYAADQQYDPALGAYQTYLSLKPNDVRATASAATLYETRARQTSAEGSAYQAQLQALQSQQSALGQSADGSSFVAFVVTGLPFDVAHAAGNVVIALIAGPTLIRMVDRYARRLHASFEPLEAPT